MTKIEDKAKSADELIDLGVASADTMGTPFPVTTIDNHLQYKPDTMGLLQD
jgi:hypothetical protein